MTTTGEAQAAAGELRRALADADADPERIRDLADTLAGHILTNPPMLLTAYREDGDLTATAEHDPTTGRTEWSLTREGDGSFGSAVTLVHGAEDDDTDVTRALLDELVAGLIEDYLRNEAPDA